MANDNNVPMNQYLRPLADHARLILLVTVLVGLLGGLAWALVPERFRSTATVLVAPISTDPSETVNSDVVVDMATEQGIASSTTVVALVAERLAEESISIDLTTLADNVTVSSPRDSRILEISYVADSAGRAQRVAEAFADVYLEYRSQLADENRSFVVDPIEQRIALLKEQITETSTELSLLREGSAKFIEVSVELEAIKSELDAQQDALANISTLSSNVGRVISPAEVPSGPEGLSLLAVVVGSIFGGFALGALIAYLLSFLRADDASFGRSRSPSAAAVGGVSPPAGDSAVAQAVEAAPAAGQLPRAGVAGGASGNGSYHGREEIDLLPAASGRAGNRTLIVETDVQAMLSRLTRMGGAQRTSRWICVGETTRDASIAAGLGLAEELRSHGAQVLLVDIMVDRPFLDALFDLDGNLGLLNVLKGSASLARASQRVANIDRLSAIPVGDPSLIDHPNEVEELLNGWGMRSIIIQATATFDAVVIVGGTIDDIGGLHTLLQESDGIVVGTERPVGQPIGASKAERLLSMPVATLGLVSMDGGQAAGAIAPDDAARI